MIEKRISISSVHGLPIITDNGSVFTSEEFSTFLQQIGTKVAPYHPSSNGLAERGVQTFKQGIAGVNIGNKTLSISFQVLLHTTCNDWLFSF